MKWVKVASNVIRQTGDSLGERMAAAFESLFLSGRERVILTGSDIPGIDAQLLQSAMAAIDGFDVVLSPAIDGGYCLVASRKERYTASIFRDIPWSTNHVLEKTLEICTTDGLLFALLDSRRDIDTLADIEAYCSQPSPDAQFTNHWLVSHGYMLPLRTTDRII
jgi:glycosyltransferase A (GT-A) superfamily protein (DUF2064 family)